MQNNPSGTTYNDILTINGTTNTITFNGTTSGINYANISGTPNLNNYYTKTESDTNYYTKTQSDTNYYTKTQSDSALALKANLASPTFTGTLTAFNISGASLSSTGWINASSYSSCDYLIVSNVDSAIRHNTPGAKINFADPIGATSLTTTGNITSNGSISALGAKATSPLQTGVYIGADSALTAGIEITGNSSGGQAFAYLDFANVLTDFKGFF